MPILPPNAKRQTTNAKNLFLVICFLFLALLLSGCSAIGYSKPSALQVTSTPEASVFLDGKHLGKTPFYSDQLKAGEYTIKVTAQEANYSSKVTLRPGTLTVVNRELNTNFLAQAGENLSLIAAEKGVFIVTFPDAADIVIDGQYVAKTPFLVTNIKDGDHRLQLTKEGYIDRDFAIKTFKKFQLLVDSTLASKIAKGVTIAQKQPAAAKSQHVLILNTPQGFLKVRKEPSLSAEVVGQVDSGGDYEVIQEVKDWYQIAADGKLGWISATYAKKVE